MNKIGHTCQSMNKLKDELIFGQVTKIVSTIAAIECYGGYRYFQLTLSQRTNFRLFLAERICRQQISV